MQKTDVSGLTQLGSATALPASPAEAVLERVPNSQQDVDYLVRFVAPEFTAMCPMTGQPDFAKLRITYQPDRLCVESKSLKLYLWSYRDRGAFHEAVTNQILDDLVAALQPRWLKVEGDFLVRGGIRTLVSAEHGQRA